MIKSAYFKGGLFLEIKTQKDAEDLIYKSYLRSVSNITETLDEKVKKPELTRKLFDLIGSPDKGQKFILVTGSKGKGSTSRFISSLLSHMGYKVGLFTSPHLVDFNERIRIDGKAIPQKEFIKISNRVAREFCKIEENLAPNEYQGPIGINLAIAVTYFRENKTDINVIEIGRGGLYDDTNILENNWAVLTNIMQEHTDNLGPKIDHIVKHKTGIVKHKTKYVYISKQTPEVLSLIHQNKFLNPDAIVCYYDTDFKAENIRLVSNGTSFDVITKRGAYKNLQIPLLGEFQAINAATAIQLCEDITGRKLDSTLVEKCFKGMQWPGRCEVVQYNPTVILDGAINESSAIYIKDVIKIISQSSKKVISIIGVPKDKDYKGVMKVLSEISDSLIVTKPDITHLSFPNDALKYAKTLKRDSTEFPYLKEAIEYAKNSLHADLILIVGTQTFIGNAKRIMGHSLLDIGK